MGLQIFRKPMSAGEEVEPPPLTSQTIMTCSMECGLLSAGGNNAHFTGVNAAISISTATKRTGNRALRAYMPTSQTAIARCFSVTPNPTVIRVYLYFQTLPSADTLLVWQQGCNGGLVYRTATQTVHCGGRTTSILSSGTGIAVTTGQWYQVDLKISWVFSGTRTVDGQINGTPLTQSVNQMSGTSPALVTLGSFASVTGEWFFDDLVISNGGADYPIGAGRVIAFTPTLDGNHNITGSGQFEKTTSGIYVTNPTNDAYTYVNKVPLPTSVTSYIRGVSGSFPSDYFEVLFGIVAGFPTPLYPRSLDAWSSWGDTGGSINPRFKVDLNDNGNIGNVLNIASLVGTSLFASPTHFALPPSGGNWGISGGNGNINNLRFRHSVQTQQGTFHAGMLEIETG